MRLPPSEQNPLLAALLEASRNHVITPEEHRAQCISFAYGNVSLHNPSITREMVEAEYDRLHPRIERPNNKS